MNNLEGLTEEISIDKEILNTLPQNNKRNTKLYADKIDELLQKYNGYNSEILVEVEKRSKKYDSLKMSDEVTTLENEVKNIEKYLFMLEENNSSYQKMGLDREISNLTYYYKNDLKVVNNTIRYSISKFKDAGISITAKDFMFNKYVNEYVSAVIDNKSEEELNSIFEKIYWKCPDIISYIEVNIRYVFLKNEKAIDKFYKGQKDKILSIFPGNTIKDKYSNLKKENIESFKKDKYLIVKKFLNGEYQVKDYNQNSILDIMKRFTGRTDLAEASEEELDSILQNLIKYLHTLIEYQNYVKFKFVIEKVKEVYNSKDQYKDAYTKTRKEIDVLEKKILKLGKTGLFKKDNDQNLAEQTKLVKELKEKYKELDLNEAYNKMISVLNEHSSLYDALKIASLYYKFLFKCIIEFDTEIQDDGIKHMVRDLRKFVNWPYFTILNNIEITEQKEIMFIIKDRYNLTNIIVTNEDLDADNVEGVINTLKKCEVYYYLKANKINLQELSETYEFKKILNNL